MIRASGINELPNSIYTCMVHIFFIYIFLIIIQNIFLLQWTHSLHIVNLYEFKYMYLARTNSNQKNKIDRQFQLPSGVNGEIKDANFSSVGHFVSVSPSVFKDSYIFFVCI